jgi:plasmid stability protein
MIAMIANWGRINHCNRGWRFDMATNLIVRNVEVEVIQLLKERAARNGRSAEAEHREILRAALSQPRKRPLNEVLLSMPNVGEDSDFERLRG